MVLKSLLCGDDVGTEGHRLRCHMRRVSRMATGRSCCLRVSGGRQACVVCTAPRRASRQDTSGHDCVGLFVGRGRIL